MALSNPSALVAEDKFTNNKVRIQPSKTTYGTVETYVNDTLVGITVAESSLQQTLADDGAITVPTTGRKTVFLTKAGASAITLGPPTADGTRITIISATAQAHTVTSATIGFNDLGAAGDVATFGGAKGDGFTVEAAGGDWWVTSNINVTIA